MWQIVNCKNGISSYEVHRAIGVTQKTAWFLDHRIRFALGMEPSPAQLSGEVEVDETFIGGKARNMHAKKRKQAITGTGPKDKVAVMGILERGGVQNEEPDNAPTLSGSEPLTKCERRGFPFRIALPAAFSTACLKKTPGGAMPDSLHFHFAYSEQFSGGVGRDH